jgi:hypothetical protein
LARATDCLSEGYGFESRYPRQLLKERARMEEYNIQDDFYFNDEIVDYYEYYRTKYGQKEYWELEAEQDKFF